MQSFFIKKTILFIFIFAFTLLLACVRRENIQGEGTPFLQGTWKESDSLNQQKQLNYSNHSFKFTCDSFYLELTTKAKVNYHPDSCYNNGIWKEYAKGTYVLRNDTLILLGVYAKSNYKQKISGCFSIGQYLQSFVIKNKNSLQIELKNLNNNQITKFSLTQKTNCIPKKL